MTDTNHMLLKQLVALGLDADEAKVYIQLLRQPTNHLRLSRLTEINRSKIYRLVTSLERRGLIARQTDDTGSFLIATDPAHLEAEITEQEQQLQKQRQALQDFQAHIASIRQHDSRAFAVKTYEGIAGMKQMVWNELHTRKQLFALGNGTVEELVQDDGWALRHRQKQAKVGYVAYSVLNDASEKKVVPVIVEANLYRAKHLLEVVTKFDNQTVVYNDTVSIYSWGESHRVGVEIINANYANTMRQMFLQYWHMARPV